MCEEEKPLKEGPVDEERVELVEGGIQVGEGVAEPENNHHKNITGEVTDALLHAAVSVAPGDPDLEVPLEEESSPTVYRSYKMRWFVLFVTALLNASNALAWIMYAPVANFVDEFYEYEGAANWLSVIFMLVTLPVALGSLWMSSRFGLRFSILVAAWFQGVGSLIRLLSHLPIVPVSGRFAVVMLGQTITACAYPFIMFLPTKVAGAWFPNNQRSLATTLTAMANPLGVLTANLLSPPLVAHREDIIYINAVTFVPSILCTILATAGIRNSDPPTAPTKSAHSDKMPYLMGLKKCFKSRAYLLLLLGLGGGMGMFNTLYTVMQQALCPVGYSNRFAGVCCCLMIVGGMVGATASGIFVDKTKRYEETVKVAFGLAVVCGCIYAQLALQTNLQWALAIVALAFGFFGLAAYPIGLEIGAECTFPVTETTSTGLIVLSGQIQGVLYVLLITKFLTSPLREDSYLRNVEVCTAEDETGLIEAKDMTWPLVVFSAIGAAIAVVFVTFFRPKLRRLGVDNQMDPIGKGGKEMKVINGKKEVEIIDEGVQTNGTPVLGITKAHPVV